MGVILRKKAKVSSWLAIYIMFSFTSKMGGKWDNVVIYLMYYKKLFVATFCSIAIIHVKNITRYLVNEAFIQLRKYVQIAWKLVWI